MEKKKLLSIGGRLIFEAAVETTLSLVLAALAGGADLGGADLRGDDNSERDEIAHGRKRAGALVNNRFTLGR